MGTPRSDGQRTPLASPLDKPMTPRSEGKHTPLDKPMTPLSGRRSAGQRTPLASPLDRPRTPRSEGKHTPLDKPMTPRSEGKHTPLDKPVTPRGRSRSRSRGKDRRGRSRSRSRSRSRGRRRERERSVDARYVDDLCRERQRYRERRDFRAADDIYHKLRCMGVATDDNRGEWTSRCGQRGRYPPSGWDERASSVDSLEVEELCQKRQQAKNDKEYRKADTFRDKLKRLGVSIDDTMCEWECRRSRQHGRWSRWGRVQDRRDSPRRRRHSSDSRDDRRDRRRHDRRRRSSSRSSSRDGRGRR